MKKVIVVLFAVMIAGGSMMSSCSSDDDPKMTKDDITKAIVAIRSIWIIRIGRTLRNGLASIQIKSNSKLIR